MFADTLLRVFRALFGSVEFFEKIFFFLVINSRNVYTCERNSAPRRCGLRGREEA
jgi:hypothetical protein